MQKYLFTILILSFIAAANFAQTGEDEDRRRKKHEKLEELAKIKLLETLQMDEETTLKFWARKLEHDNRGDSLELSRENLLKNLEQKLKNEEALTDDEYYKELEKFVELETQLFENRRNFQDSMSDLLSAEQLAKLAVFEFAFMRYVRKVMREGRGRGRKE